MCSLGWVIPKSMMLPYGDIQSNAHFDFSPIVGHGLSKYVLCLYKEKLFHLFLSSRLHFSITPYNPLNIILYIHRTFNLPSLLNTQYSTRITYSAVAAYQSLLLYQFMLPVIIKKILLHIVYLLSYSALMPVMHHTAVICLLEWNVYRCLFLINFLFFCPRLPCTLTRVLKTFWIVEKALSSWKHKVLALKYK